VLVDTVDTNIAKNRFPAKMRFSTSQRAAGRTPASPAKQPKSYIASRDGHRRPDRLAAACFEIQRRLRLRQKIFIATLNTA
jgi:hypothetical protein